MDRDNKFSIYTSQSVRIVLHIIYWVAIYFFALFVNWYLIKGALFGGVNMLFTFGVIFTTMLIHYFLCYITINYVRHKRWAIVLLHLIIVYLISVVSTTSFLRLLEMLYPDNNFVNRAYQRFEVDSWQKVFSYNSLMWILTVTVWYNVLGITIKIIKDFYESLQEKMAIVKERNYMELNFLRAQIQPHFLFNSLNNIYGLVIDNEKASQVVLQLSNLLRFSLYDSTKNDVTLKEEIDFLTNYILLEKMRHKESRVLISYDFEQIQNKEKFIKPLILVNFIENAFKHGINASIKHTWVKINVTEQNGILTMRVENNKTLPSISRKADGQVGGVGMKNVKRRLELEYPSCFSLDIKETEEVYEVILVIKLHH